MKKFWFVKPDSYKLLVNAIKYPLYDSFLKDFGPFFKNGIYITVIEGKPNLWGYMPYPKIEDIDSKKWLIKNGYIYMGDISRKSKLENLKNNSNK